MCVHLAIPWLVPGGFLGVDVFFVLSGFLITWLLIHEWDTTGHQVSFRNFYIRRALRLFPAAACTILASAALAVLTGIAATPGGRASARATLAGVPWVILYVGNWVRALNIGSLGLLGQTWSLSVEEQFYLLWPALFVLLSRIAPVTRRRAAWILAVLALADMVYRVAIQVTGTGLGRLYYGTDTHCDGLVLGCAVAFWLASGQRSLRPLVAGGMAWLGAAALVVLFLTGSKYDISVEIPATVLATAAILACLITGQAPRNVGHLLSSRVAVWIGKRSYGLYLWHYLVYQAIFGAYLHFVPGGLNGEHAAAYAVRALAFACSFVVAALSYRFVELPALRLKRRFKGRPAKGRHRRAVTA